MLVTRRRGSAKIPSEDASRRESKRTDSLRSSAPADARFADAASMLRVLGVVAHLRLVVCLLDGPRTVAELAGLASTSRLAVARSLTVLSHARLVRRIVEGSSVQYELGGERVRHLVQSIVARVGVTSGTPV
jgi:DNA-binding transcriptional ArsR family regulator